MDLLVVAITLQHISEYANNVHPSDKENDPDAARGLSVRLNQVQSKREFSSTGPGKPAKRIKSE